MEIQKGAEARESQQKAVVPKRSRGSMAGSCEAEGSHCGWGFPEQGVPETAMFGAGGRAGSRGWGEASRVRILMLFSFIYTLQ